MRVLIFESQLRYKVLGAISLHWLCALAVRRVWYLGLSKSHGLSKYKCTTALCIVGHFVLSTVIYYIVMLGGWGERWCSLLRHCATCRKVTGSIFDGVTGIFH